MYGTAQYDYRGARVVVTGGARGQGLAHAAAFAAAGADVIVFDVPDSERPGVPYPLSGRADLDAATERLAELPGIHTVLAVDVTDSEAVAAAYNDMAGRYGTVDVIVNNAGVNAVEPLEAITKESWDALIGVNLWGAFAATRHGVPLMREHGGSVLFISSLAAVLGVPGQAHYAASKAGLLGLTRALAVELGPHRIRVNALAPTVVASPQTRELSKLTPPRQSMPAYALPGITALSTDDVSHAVLWVCSAEARCLTGATIMLDAGLSVR